MTVTEKILAAYDAHTTESSVNRNNGDTSFLRVRTDTGENRFAWIFFPMDIVKMEGATVLEATIRLFHKGTNASSTLTARRVTQRWKERKITHKNRPETTATNAGTATGGGADKEFIDIDVTDLAQAWVNGKAVYGIRLSTDAATAKNFYSSESAARWRPRLLVEWAKPGEIATDLVPDGDQAVDAAAPLLTWEANTPTSVWVQIDTTDDFASPVYDSGWVDQDDTAFDTALAGSPPTLTDNTAYFWRVKFMDEFGIESEWSEPASFQRRTFGALNITAPGAIVEDTTPEITHTFTGRTQTAVQYVLTEQEPGEAEVTIYNSKRSSSTDTDFVLPHKVAGKSVGVSGYETKARVLLRSLTATYRIYVRVWDEYGRADRPPYVEDVQSFTFEQGAIDPVTNLAAITRHGHVFITFNRTAIPDYFAVREDGKLIENRIEPADISLGGTAYGIELHSSTPRAVHEYEIEAVVDDSGVLKHSESNPTITKFYNPSGIWLVEPESGIDVRILGVERDASVDSVIGETGVTFFVIGRPDPVRIVDQIRGLEGTVSGELVTYDDRTAAEEKANFESMKENPTQELRLIWGSRNIPVIIGESALRGDPGTEESYGIEFVFWQVDEFDIEVENALS